MRASFIDIASLSLAHYNAYARRRISACACCAPRKRRACAAYNIARIAPYALFLFARLSMPRAAQRQRGMARQRRKQ
jgi:hypothetical protein